jgi:hypothetical protein
MPNYRSGGALTSGQSGAMPTAFLCVLDALADQQVDIVMRHLGVGYPITRPMGMPVSGQAPLAPAWRENSWGMAEPW